MCIKYKLEELICYLFNMSECDLYVMSLNIEDDTNMPSTISPAINRVLNPVAMEASEFP